MKVPQRPFWLTGKSRIRVDKTMVSCRFTFLFSSRIFFNTAQCDLYHEQKPSRQALNDFHKNVSKETFFQTNAGTPRAHPTLYHSLQLYILSHLRLVMAYVMILLTHTLSSAHFL